MKTAMQEAIEKIENCFDWDETKEMLINLLEKEKEQIINAYCDGFKQGSEGDRIMSEEYYIETYKQNKLIINTNGKVGLSNPDETTNNKLIINQTEDDENLKFY